DSNLLAMVNLRKRNMLEISTTTSAPNVQGEKYDSTPRKQRRTRQVNSDLNKSADDTNNDENSNENDNDSSDDYAERPENIGYLSYQTQMNSSMPIFEFPMNLIYSMNATTLVPKGKVVGLEWDGTIPIRHSDIFKCENTQRWIDAENKELQNLENHKTYVEVPISEVPEGTEIIPTMEVYSVKNHKDLPADVVEKYKVRIVV
ncbi:hypothetical protein HDU81_011297, partial [Chytriomyces hyalinus]